MSARLDPPRVKDDHAGMDATAGPETARRPWEGPRWVLVIAVLILVVVAGSAALSAGQLTETRRRTSRANETLGVPLGHLLDTSDANLRGQMALAAAVATIGAERDGHVGHAIVTGDAISAAFEAFSRSRAGLPGEKDVIDRFARHLVEAHEASTAALTPLLISSAAGTLPIEQIARFDAVNDDIVTLVNLYRAAQRSEIGALVVSERRYRMVAWWWWSALILAVTGIALAALRVSRRAVAERIRRGVASGRASFEADLQRALELVADPPAAFSVACRALEDAFPGRTAAVLVANASATVLEPVAAAPSCRVSRPDDCPALRNGVAFRTLDSGDLTACPVLAAAVGEPCGATCFPVSVAGRHAALVHVADRPGGGADDERGLAEILARCLGERVAVLETLATFALQAGVDPLTGLLNRRSLDAAVERLLGDGTRYAVAFGDLDRFKRLNDLHGHKAGDEALQAFAATLRQSLRAVDLACRWGGEEFVIVLPDCDTALAAQAMERVRENLGREGLHRNVVPFTVSFGVADSRGADGFREVVERADGALRVAKDEGRDRVVRHPDPVADPESPVDGDGGTVQAGEGDCRDAALHQFDRSHGRTLA